MNENQLTRSKRLLACIGEIENSFLEETELADIVSDTVARKRLARYSALAAAASVGIAAAYWLIRAKRASSKSVSLQSA